MSLGLATMSTSFYSEISHASTPIDDSDYDPHALPSYLSPLKLQYLCECANNITKLKILATPHPQLHWWITHFQYINHTIQHLKHLLQKEQEELHKVFSMLEVEGVTKVLAPLIIRKRVKWYKSYQVYQRRWWSPTSIPLPDSPPVQSPIPSHLPTPSPKSPVPSPKSLSSYHTAPSQQHNVVWCKGCNEDGHILEKCIHNYCWNPDTKTYTPIPYREKMTVPCYSGWTPVLELKKTGKSLS